MDSSDEKNKSKQSIKEMLDNIQHGGFDGHFISENFPENAKNYLSADFNKLREAIVEAEVERDCYKAAEEVSEHAREDLSAERNSAFEEIRILRAYLRELLSWLSAFPEEVKRLSDQIDEAPPIEEAEELLKPGRLEV